MGLGRIALQAELHAAQYLTVTVQRIAEPSDRGPEINARAHQIRERGTELLSLVEHAPPELTATLRSVEQPGALADFVIGLLEISPYEKQEVLETVELLPRLDRVLSRLTYRPEVLRLSHDIGQETQQAMEGRQREFMLLEQLKAILKELVTLRTPSLERTI